MLCKTALLIAILSAVTIASNAQQSAEKLWRFAVSGDSRNCGDVVMPAIAKSARAHEIAFYWHLGDFRVGYAVDEDMQDRAGGKLLLEEYYRTVWDDFISNQMTPFGSVKIHLGIGNHELYLHGNTKDDQNLSHTEFVTKFNKWLGGSNTAYYRWKEKQIDFINLDNSFNEGFDDKQMEWLEWVLKEDRADDTVRAIVVGMHRALPNSLACGHSMNGDSSTSGEDNAKSLRSGRLVYEYLWNFQNTTGKHVYVLASHSHLYMQDIFNTNYWNYRNEKDRAVLGDKGIRQRTLDGWLIGTAGAVRYRLPEGLLANTLAITYAYGYLLGTVNADGTIAFEFQQVTENDVPPDAASAFHKTFVDACFLANRDDSTHTPEPSCAER